jgi:broad specificity phosphatase PhoE
MITGFQPNWYSSRCCLGVFWIRFGAQNAPRTDIFLVNSPIKPATADTNDGEGAESFRDFITRVQMALERLHNRPEHSILVVCHEFVIKAGMWLGTRTPEFGNAHTPQRFREHSLAFRVSNLAMWDCR